MPLATDLGLTVDTSCDRDDSDCVADAVNDYSGSGNILIWYVQVVESMVLQLIITFSWEHKRLNNIVEELGADDVDNYPSDSFDIIWTDPYPYTEITSTTSENCPGLDN